MKIHFIGIGGIGMSALAQLFEARGDVVSGSDRDPSPAVHTLLEEKGIKVFVGHRRENVPKDVDLVVYSDAVVPGSEGMVERDEATAQGAKERSYFEALGEVSQEYRTIAVSGTHGKTTTTGLLGKTLIDAGQDPTIVVGSLVRDFSGNYVQGASDLLVVEACEYRGHLLQLAPEILIITNVEWDHSDWFPSLSAVQETFKKAVAALPENGVVVTDARHPNIVPIISGSRKKIIDYTEVAIGELSLLGEFNRMNARAAKAAVRAVVTNADDAVIDRSLAGFAGSWRRFEYKGKTEAGAPVYDDYAHHPTAIRETLLAARERFPETAITVLFQPHLYSRTRDLFEGFTHALSIADRVLIMPVYPARERADEYPGVTSEALAAAVAEINGSAEAKDEVAAVRELSTLEPVTVVITMGAGVTDRVAETLTKQQ